MRNSEIANWPKDYVIRVLDEIAQVPARAWDMLLNAQSQPTPFMRHAYLQALQASACASAQTGWHLQVIVIEKNQELRAATVLYIKSHSRGEYVFDHAWAHAYARHGFNYYPKSVCAVPFTPVPGSRLLAVCEQDRSLLAQAMLAWAGQQNLSGLHVLFADANDMQACLDAGMQERRTVQFHWNNRTKPYQDFDDFLASMSQAKRKKIRQERRKVAQAGVQLKALQGVEIQSADWDFFYRCYERNYLEHGNLPYLSRAFFKRIEHSCAQDWVLFLAMRDAQPIAASLIAINASCAAAQESGKATVAYGRYWGALERVDCLHFEACYYSPIAWCIEHGIERFEGGAQGEHKLSRALLPVIGQSAHWLAHPDFFEAVDRYLLEERSAMTSYFDELQRHSPLKSDPLDLG